MSLRIWYIPISTRDILKSLKGYLVDVLEDKCFGLLQSSLGTDYVHSFKWLKHIINSKRIVMDTLLPFK